MKKLLPTACLFVVTISPLIMSPAHAQRDSQQTVGLEKVELSIVEKIRDEALNRSHMGALKPGPEAPKDFKKGRR